MDVFDNTGVKILLILFFVTVAAALARALDYEWKMWEARMRNDLPIRWADKFMLVVLGLWFGGATVTTICLIIQTFFRIET